MNYYKKQPSKQQGMMGNNNFKLVKADQSPLLQKSANGVRFKMVLAPNGQRFAVVVHKKGDLKPYRNEDRLPKAVRRHRIKAA